MSDTSMVSGIPSVTPLPRPRRSRSRSEAGEDTVYDQVVDVLQTIFDPEIPVDITSLD